MEKEKTVLQIIADWLAENQGKEFESLALKKVIVIKIKDKKK